jgi:hypothetical protein
MHKNIVEREADFTECGHYIHQQYLYRIVHLIERFNEYLSTIEVLDKDYLAYKWDGIVTNNDVNNFDYVDFYVDDTNLAEKHLVAEKSKSTMFPEWGKLDAKLAKVLLSKKLPENVLITWLPEKNTGVLDTHIASENERCKYIENLIVVFSYLMKNATNDATTLQALISNVRANKLNNNLLTDYKLLKEMKNATSVVRNRHRAWVNDNRTDSNGHFNLAEAYRLYLFMDKNYSLILFVVMPLLNENNVSYNVYRIMTVPFCRGRICLFMIPNNEYIAVSMTKNYYIPFSFEECTLFAGYDEYLCPETNTLPTINSKTCEIEMYMGRYANVMDKYCDLRLGTLLSDSAYILPLMEYRKWLYMFHKKLNIGYFCNELSNNDGTLSVGSGIGILSAKLADTCSVRISSKMSIASDSRFYVTESFTYWPKNRFSYYNYFDQNVFGNASVKLLKKINSIKKLNLLTLSTQFVAKDYQKVHTFFKPSFTEVKNDSLAHLELKNLNLKLEYLFVIVFGSVLLLIATVLIIWCCYKKRSRIAEQATVKYNNLQKKTDRVHLIDDSERGKLLYVTFKKEAPNVNVIKQSSVYPMKLKELK